MPASSNKSLRSDKAQQIDVREMVATVIAAHETGEPLGCVVVSGCEFTVSPNVFNPTIAPSGKVGMCFATLPVVQDEIVADVGAGSGIFSCLFAHNRAKRVIATDISDAALENIAKNVASHGLSDSIEIRKGRGLDPIDAADAVTVIYCDLPFADWKRPESDLERAFFDDELSSIRQVLRSLSTCSHFERTKLYLCVSSLSSTWKSHVRNLGNLARRRILVLEMDWISLELWEVSRASQTAVADD